MNDSGFKLFGIRPLNVLCKDRRLLRSSVNIEHMRTLLSWGPLQTPTYFLIDNNHPRISSKIYFLNREHTVLHTLQDIYCCPSSHLSSS